MFGLAVLWIIVANLKRKKFLPTPRELEGIKEEEEGWRRRMWESGGVGESGVTFSKCLFQEYIEGIVSIQFQTGDKYERGEERGRWEFTR